MAASSLGKPVAMISSTVRDLPQHRDKVLRACLRAAVCSPEGRSVADLRPSDRLRLLGL
jgi:hypothetical protein